MPIIYELNSLWHWSMFPNWSKSFVKRCCYDKQYTRIVLFVAKENNCLSCRLNLSYWQNKNKSDSHSHFSFSFPKTPNLTDMYNKRRGFKLYLQKLHFFFFFWSDEAKFGLKRQTVKQWMDWEMESLSLSLISSVPKPMHSSLPPKHFIL